MLWRGPPPGRGIWPAAADVMQSETVICWLSAGSRRVQPHLDRANAQHVLAGQARQRADRLAIHEGTVGGIEIRYLNGTVVGDINLGMPARRERIIAKKRRQPAFPAQHDARRGHRYPPSPVTSRDDHQARYLTFAASRSIGRNDGLPRRMVRTHEQRAGPHHIGGPSRGLCLSGHDLCSCLLGTGRDARLSAGFTVTGGLAGHHTGKPTDEPRNEPRDYADGRS